MGSLYPGLLSFFAMLTSALSLLPSFSPIIPDSTGISNFTNQTLPNLTSDPRLTCDKRYGEDLSVASCRHALQKILRSSESHRFTRGRKKPQASSDQTPTPIRYLSDDGICAIVCFPSLFFLFHSYLIVVLQTRHENTRAISPCV